MNLEDMKKVWDSESNQTLYVIDQSKVEQMVNNKSMSANKRASYVENFIIIMNLIVPVILFVIGGLNDKIGFGEYSMAVFCLISVGATFIYKRKRLSSQLNSGDTMLDNLKHAIHNATYQARMTDFFLTWYILGVGVLSIFNLVKEGTNIWIVISMALVFVVGLIVGRWEQRCWHEKKRDELISLLDKLEEEN